MCFGWGVWILGALGGQMGGEAEGAGSVEDK